MCNATENETTEAQPSSGSKNVGAVKGLIGTIVENVGVLDLIGVDPSVIAKLESIKNVGAVLVSEGMEAAVSHAVMENVGAVISLPPDCQFLVESWTEFDSEMLEAMSPNQKLAIVGMVLIKPNVSAALLAEKIESLTMVGILFASSRVKGALYGRSKIVGTTVTIPDDLKECVRWLGDTVVSEGYLEQLPDDALFLNVGNAEFDEGLPLELVKRKVAKFCNVGNARASTSVADLLRARCAANLGNIEVRQA